MISQAALEAKTVKGIIKAINKASMIAKNKLYKLTSLRRKISLIGTVLAVRKVGIQMLIVNSFQAASISKISVK